MAAPFPKNRSGGPLVHIRGGMSGLPPEEYERGEFRGSMIARRGGGSRSRGGNWRKERGGLQRCRKRDRYIKESA